MKKQEIVDMVFQDTHEFLLTRDNWDKVKSKGQYIAYGLLNAVFDVIFSLAPSKESAMEIINMSLTNFLLSEEDKQKMEIDNTDCCICFKEITGDEIEYNKHGDPFCTQCYKEENK